MWCSVLISENYMLFQVCENVSNVRVWVWNVACESAEVSDNEVQLIEESRISTTHGGGRQKGKCVKNYRVLTVVYLLLQN